MRGVPKEKISFARDTYTFNFPTAPSELVDAFRKYYGPTMNAFEAAEKKVEPVICRRSWKFCSKVRTQAQAGTPPPFRRPTYALRFRCNGPVNSQ